MNTCTQYIICILLVFAPIANTVFAISYRYPITTDEGFAQVSQQNITEASLLETYVSRYKNNINTSYAQYSQKESLIIQNANKTLTHMSQVLQKIQEESVNPENVDEIMNSIVQDLKKLNRRLKVYFQQQRDIFDQKLLDKKIQYEKVALKISSILDSLILSQTKILIKIPTLSENQKKLVEILVNIQRENMKIKKFKDTNFENEQEMKLYFQNIIKNIRLEVQSIKKYL